MSDVNGRRQRLDALLQARPGLKRLDATLAGLRHFPDPDLIPAVERLNLSSNDIAFIPPGISSLVRLRYLNLGAQSVRLSGYEHLRPLRLDTLALASNQIDSLGDLARGAPGTRYLDLRGNRLTQLSDVPWASVDWEEVDLGENALADATGAAEMLARAPRLRKVSFSLNRLTRLPAPDGGTLVEEVDFFRNPITSIDSTIRLYRNARTLSFSETPLSSITDDVAALTELRMLALPGTISETRVQELHAMMPWCTILHLLGSRTRMYLAAARDST